MQKIIHQVFDPVSTNKFYHTQSDYEHINKRNIPLESRQTTVFKHSINWTNIDQLILIQSLNLHLEFFTSENTIFVLDLKIVFEIPNSYLNM